MKRFILYRHIRPDKDEPFYIGIGEKYRATNFLDGRNKHWKSIFNQNNKNIEVDILEEGLSWEDACKKEVWWISFYGRSDLGKGPLCNLTNGGEGGYGRINTPEQIEGKRQRMLVHGDRIRACKTSEGLERTRQSAIGRVKSKEERSKISASKLGKKNKMTDKFKRYLNTMKGSSSPFAKKVIDTDTGITYGCIRDAAISIGMTPACLARKINGSRNNNTSFTYLID